MSQKSNLLTATVTSDMQKRVEELAQEMDLSKAQIIRMALNQFMADTINRPALTMALVQVCDQIEEWGRNHGNKDDTEMMKEIQNSLALVIELERNGGYYD
ncbi:MAG: ribbon-helix-helix protein, CopG family [Lachnospiraceae bacterium]|nr:ribbon-helix-helix protein, CopG family [Lachnospiraceae bacterium]